MKKATAPLPTREIKQDYIEQFNNEHLDDLRKVACTFSKTDVSAALLKDVSNDGCSLVSITKSGQKEDLFLPFKIKGDIEEQITYLELNTSITVCGRVHKQENQVFEIVGTKKPYPNFLSIEIRSQSPIAKAAHSAYALSLKSADKPNKLKDSFFESLMKLKLFNRAVVFLFRLASHDARQKILHIIHSPYRVFNVKDVWQEGDYEHAVIDVYLRPKSLTSTWATDLKQGQFVQSVYNQQDDLKFLNRGQTLLIADESSLPALARLLKNWKNPALPCIITITNDDMGQHYLDRLKSKYKKRYKIVTSDLSTESVGEEVVSILSKISGLEKAWGGLESHDATLIRAHLRNDHGITGSQNRVCGYWTKQEDSSHTD